MLAFVEPAHPARVRASPFDRSILPLLAAASSGRPLIPTMQSMMRRPGFTRLNVFTKRRSARGESECAPNGEALPVLLNCCSDSRPTSPIAQESQPRPTTREPRALPFHWTYQSTARTVGKSRR